jgi:hypothetical protein
MSYHNAFQIKYYCTYLFITIVIILLIFLFTGHIHIEYAEDRKKKEFFSASLPYPQVLKTVPIL